MFKTGTLEYFGNFFLPYHALLETDCSCEGMWWEDGEIVKCILNAVQHTTDFCSV